MKTLLKTFLAIALSICTLEAKGGGFSSSSKSFGSSSKSYGSSSASKSSPSSAKYTGSNISKPGSTSTQTSSRVTSNVETARYQSAVKSGKAFATRESAVADFKSKNTNTFVNKFTTEPAKRPDYIPSNYTTGGKTYNITYNQNSGGYGYWSGGGPGLGTWMMYDALSDMAMMNTLMARDNYYVGSAPSADYDDGDDGVSDSFRTVMLWVTGSVVLIIVAISAFGILFPII